MNSSNILEIKYLIELYVYVKMCAWYPKIINKNFKHLKAKG
jgi:hypothetical protein